MFKYLRVLARWIPYLIYSYFAWILPYSIHPEKYDLEIRFKKVKKLCSRILDAFHVEKNSIGLEKFLKEKGNQNTLLVSNHLSFLDPVYYVSISEKPISFVAKEEVRKMIFVGRIVKILDGEFINRDDLKQELRAFLRVQDHLKNKNMDYIIFPEGTRNKHPEGSIPFYHYGTFRPAYKLHLPIEICVLSGSQRILDIKCNKKYYPVTCEFIKCLKYDEYKDMNTTQIAEEAHELTNESYSKIKEQNDRLFIERNSKKK